MLSITDVFYLTRVVQSKHNALPISRGQFFSKQLTKGTHSSRVRGKYGCLSWVRSVTKFYLRNRGAVCNNVLYSTAVYRESIVLCTWHCFRSWVNSCFRLVGTWRQDICIHPDDVGRMVPTWCSPPWWGLGIGINLINAVLYTKFCIA